MPNPFDDFADLGGVEYIEPYSTHGETILHGLHRFHAWPKVVFIGLEAVQPDAYQRAYEAEQDAFTRRALAPLCEALTAVGRALLDPRARQALAHEQIARVCAR